MPYKFNPFIGNLDDVSLDTIAGDLRYLKLDQTTPQYIINGPLRVGAAGSQYISLDNLNADQPTLKAYSGGYGVSKYFLLDVGSLMTRVSSVVVPYADNSYSLGWYGTWYGNNWNYRWQNLYLTGIISDGTNSITMGNPFNFGASGILTTGTLGAGDATLATITAYKATTHDVFKVTADAGYRAYSIFITGKVNPSFYNLGAGLYFGNGTAAVDTWLYRPTSPVDEVATLATNSDIQFLSDTKGAIFGAGKDASIVYDGTNLNINPKLVGTGYVNISGSLSAVNVIRYQMFTYFN